MFQLGNGASPHTQKKSIMLSTEFIHHHCKRQSEKKRIVRSHLVLETLALYDVYKQCHSQPTSTKKAFLLAHHYYLSRLLLPKVSIYPWDIMCSRSLHLASHQQYDDIKLLMGPSGEKPPPLHLKSYKLKTP